VNREKIKESRITSACKIVGGPAFIIQLDKSRIKPANGAGVK